MKTSVVTFCKSRTRRQGDRETGRQGRFSFRSLLVSLSPCLLVFFSAACGKIGDPLPPIPRSKLTIDELNVEQQGTRLILSFPFTRTPRTRLQRVDVYRLIESDSAPQGMPIEIFSEKAGIIQSITADQIPLNGAKINFNDELDLRGGQRSVRYRYAIRLINTAGQAADFSNYAMIAPLFNLSTPPDGFKAKQLETQIEISWDKPASNVNETTPANVAAYNIYRKSGESVFKLNTEPLRAPLFVDRNFQFGTTYQYMVRSLSLPARAASMSEAIESADSKPFEYTPKDTFPPISPKPVTIASINSLVSLFWPLNAEADVVGYNIYRTEDENAPPDKWIKLNPELHKTASFRDERVQVGKRYFYQITAVDAFGNESARSETVSETVAP